MKKKLAVSLALAGVIAGSFAIGVYAATDIKLFINGKQISADLQIVNGSSYVPLRVVSESLGADVKWDGDARTISINGGTSAAVVTNSAANSFDINVNVNSGPMTLNVSKVTLDPAYKHDKYSKPIKAVILESSVENTSDAEVLWFPSHAKLALNTKEQVESGMLYSDDVDGHFIGKVVKKGKIVFEVKNSELADITSMSYVVDGSADGKTYGRLGDDKKTEIILK